MGGVTSVKGSPNNKIGKSYWFDLPARNVLDAMSFYEGLFGWKYFRMSESELENYWIIQQGDERIGGLRETAKDNGKKAEIDVPILYFTVKELQPAVARAKELGAKLVGERVELGKERGAYQWIRDREQNLIALWGPS